MILSPPSLSNFFPNNLKWWRQQSGRFQPISCHWSLSIPPENIRKPEVYRKRPVAGNGLRAQQLPKAVVQRYSVKKVFLHISQNSQENTYARFTFLIKLQAEACNFAKKETLAQVFFCEILRTHYFIEHLSWLLLSFNLKEINKSNLTLDWGRNILDLLQHSFLIKKNIASHDFKTYFSICPSFWIWTCKCIEQIYHFRHNFTKIFLRLFTVCINLRNDSVELKSKNKIFSSSRLQVRYRTAILKTTCDGVLFSKVVGPTWILILSQTKYYSVLNCREEESVE